MSLRPDWATGWGKVLSGHLSEAISEEKIEGGLEIELNGKAWTGPGVQLQLSRKKRKSAILWGPRVTVRVNWSLGYEGVFEALDADHSPKVPFLRMCFPSVKWVQHTSLLLCRAVRKMAAHSLAERGASMGEWAKKSFFSESYHRAVSEGGAGLAYVQQGYCLKESL